jgi:hypothetical protein
MKLDDSLMFQKKSKLMILIFLKNWNCRLILVKIPLSLKELGGPRHNILLCCGRIFMDGCALHTLRKVLCVLEVK